MKLDLLMDEGITNILNIVKKNYFKQNKTGYFLTKVLPSNIRKYQIRANYQKEGLNIPPFLIASITSSCNLNCAGCYAMANDSSQMSDLNTQQWHNIFSEASQIGVSFILLAGGEPLLRRDVIEQAAIFPDLIFPIFTNGTILDDEYLTLFKQKQNLVPIISIEGNEIETDKRRGTGIYQTIVTRMEQLQKQKIIYGVSITVTKENYKLVTSTEFINELKDRGCATIIYVEYVPVDQSTIALALDDNDIEAFTQEVTKLKNTNDSMALIHFPGDEAKMGGCLASGRGFFHINANGGAEPCPFSPYSKLNLKNNTIIEVLQSDFFKKTRKIAQEANHKQGGCTLFNQEAKVKEI